MMVVVSCDTAGWIVPCGCSSKQAGGLLRRASYVDGLRKSSDVVLADAGGAPGGVSEYDKLKFEYVLRGEVEMQTAAHNIGAAEAELGASVLRDLSDRVHAPFVSTNIRDDARKPIAATSRIVTVGGRKVTVMGVLSTKYSGHGLHVDDPYESLRKTIRDLKEPFDSLLVLAYLPEDELEALVARLPEADMIVGGPTRQTIAPKRAGPAIWAATTNKGKFLVQIERPTPKSPWEGKIVELSTEISDNAKQVDNLNRFRDELSRVDFRAEQTSFSPVIPADSPKDFLVAGTDACRDCHQNDCQIWSSSSHAHAWQTLLDKKSQMDPYCQHCHTTGYGLPGGFRSMADGGIRENVGCESCHGPAKTHVANSSSKTLYQASDRCAACHDHENSPQFEYDGFWKKIGHGSER
jgi:hypothetical protein